MGIKNEANAGLVFYYDSNGRLFRILERAEPVSEISAALECIIPTIHSIFI